MKYSTRLADAIHILVLIATSDACCTSAKLAESIATNPAHIRKLMSQLKKSGILLTTQGKAAPALCAAPEEITLLDLYRCMEGDTPLLHLDTHTNPDCHEGIHIQLALQEYYDQLQKSFEEQMKQITLSDLIERYHQRIQQS